MIVCSQCLHRNLADATHCEACGANLVIEEHCPNCGAIVQEAYRFCGQCGFLLETELPPPKISPVLTESSPASSSEIQFSEEFTLPPPEIVAPNLSLDTLSSPVMASEAIAAALESPDVSPVQPIATAEPTQPPVSPTTETPFTLEAEEGQFHTTIQSRTAKLLHLQTNHILELTEQQKAIHIGKPNERLMPDINVAQFPNGEVVSRVHATIHIEQGVYSIEDTGSANGTYLNGMALTPGTPYRLRTGDKICLGKGELVTFIFKI
jgi:hypothetical protein